MCPSRRTTNKTSQRAVNCTKASRGCDSGIPAHSFAPTTSACSLSIVVSMPTSFSQTKSTTKVAGKRRRRQQDAQISNARRQHHQEETPPSRRETNPVVGCWAFTATQDMACFVHDDHGGLCGPTENKAPSKERAYIRNESTPQTKQKPKQNPKPKPKQDTTNPSMPPIIVLVFVVVVC